MTSRFITTLFRLDPWLLGASIFLSVVGLLNLAGTPNSQTFFFKQVFFVAFGIAALIGMASFDYRWFRSSPLFGFAVWGGGVALLAVAAFFGETVRGAQNWLFIGPFALGPVEIVKFGVLLVLARYLAREHAALVFPSRVVASAGVVLVPIALTFFQPDLGSAMVLGAMWFFLVLLLRIPLRTSVVIVLLLFVVSGIAWNAVLHEYQRDRIASFLTPENDPLGAAYQTRQATIAVGAGGLSGRGFFSDDLSSNLAFLPENVTDFAFASVVERSGFLGALLLFVAFILLVGRVQRVAEGATNNFSRVYAAGLFVLFATEFTLNIGMNLGMLPVTGIPLPFVSYGGSHMFLAFISLGLLESIRLHQPHTFVYDRDPISAIA